jgi:chemotaxis response regulator CheB
VAADDARDGQGTQRVNAQPDIEVVGEAVNGQEAVTRAAELRPDVILMDVRMPVLDGLQATRQIAAADGAPKVLILTTFDLDDYVYEALRCGASGFLLKDVGTVAWEEIAFRGVLQAALRRVLAQPAATAVASATFGVWHIRPAAEALAVNRLAASRGARIAAVTAVAAGSAAAGALLSALRERSGNLAAPVLLHLAANCTAPLASALARTLSARTSQVPS